MTLEQRARLIASKYPGFGMSRLSPSDFETFILQHLREACNETISRCRGPYPSDGEMMADPPPLRDLGG